MFVSESAIPLKKLITKPQAKMKKIYKYLNQLFPKLTDKRELELVPVRVQQQPKPGNRYTR